MKIPKTVTLKTLVAAILATLLACGFIFYVLAPTPTSTFWITPGVYPGAPDFTIWVESSNYFAKDQNGQIAYSGSNFSEVINDCIDALPTAYVHVEVPTGTYNVHSPNGWIYIAAGEYTLDSTILIPACSRIKISGVGTTQQDIKNGVNGGTMITNTGSGSALEVQETIGSDFVSATAIVELESIEFVQESNLYDNSTSVLDLDGMAQGFLRNIQVVSDYARTYLVMDGIGIRHHVNNSIGDTDAPTTWEQVNVVGFDTGVYLRKNWLMADYLDIARCDLAMNWSIGGQNEINTLHFFNCSRFIHVWGGFSTYGTAYINGLYIESSGDDGDGQLEWMVNSTFHGMLKINRVFCDNSLASDLWNINTDNFANCKIWFTDVVTSTSTAFPSVTSPSYASWINVTNTFMQLIEVSISFNNTVTGLEIQINGLNVTDGGTADAADGYTFILRPGDRIAVNANADRTNWVWRAVSAERWHYDD